jgi:hypothetical protein
MSGEFTISTGLIGIQPSVLHREGVIHREAVHYLNRLLRGGILISYTDIGWCRVSVGGGEIQTPINHTPNHTPKSSKFMIYCYPVRGTSHPTPK